MKNAIKNITLAALAAIATAAGAQTMDHGKMHGTTAATAATAPAAEMTDGEIKKVDKDNKKLTIKHGDIKNLDMPGMTMVFQLKEPAMLDRVKVGDKIRFRAEKGGSGFLVTELQPAGN